LPVKTAQFTQFFRQVCSHTIKSLCLTERLYGALRLRERWKDVRRTVDDFMVREIHGRSERFLFKRGSMNISVLEDPKDF
jgi:hypothetical protein